jgi:hypothetical protein
MVSSGQPLMISASIVRKRQRVCGYNHAGGGCGEID